MEASVLAQRSLVLNKSWIAIATTPVRDAMRLLFTGSAKAVRPDTFEIHDFASWADLAVSPEEPCVRTVRLRIRIPDVIVLTQFNGMPNREVVFSRRNLYKRDAFTCQYCGRRPGGSELSIDHIVPRAFGGKSTWENCVLACMPCNRKKAHRPPEAAGLKLRKKPVRPRWTPALEIPLGRVKQSWERFIDERYWDVRLEP